MIFLSEIKVHVRALHITIFLTRWLFSDKSATPGMLSFLEQK